MTTAPTTLTRPRRDAGQLQARTAPGRDLVAAVDTLVPALAAEARQGDRTRTFPNDSLDVLRDHGVLRAPIPAALGGGDVRSVHDLVVAAGRIARADPSLAIGVNMHLVTMSTVSRGWWALCRIGDEVRAAGVGAALRAFATSGAAVAAAISEPGPQDLSRPSTTAVRAGDEWRIDGVKAFSTMSPAADLLNVAVTYVDGAGEERYGFALVPTGTPGVTVHDDWDALGMRASGSGRVTLEGVVVATVNDSHPAGRTSVEGLDRYLTSGLFHASATLGVAEAAHELALGAPERRHRLASGARSLLQVADSTIDLATMRAVLERAALRVDTYLDEQVEGIEHDLEEASEVFAAVQQAKAFVDVAGPRVVDRALELSGGAGYLTAHPLSQAYRDVRAGAFMHPMGANRAYELIGQVALGEEAVVR